MTVKQANMRVILPLSVVLIVLGLQGRLPIADGVAIFLTLLGLLGVVVAAYVFSHDTMNLREFNARILSPWSQWAMVLGIIFLCQPWFEFLHIYSVTIMLIGIIGFNFAVHIPPPEKIIDEDDTGPASVGETVSEARGHG